MTSAFHSPSLKIIPLLPSTKLLLKIMYWLVQHSFSLYAEKTYFVISFSIFENYSVVAKHQTFVENNVLFSAAFF